MSAALQIVTGSFALLKRRAMEIGRPGLGLYAEAGTAAAALVNRVVEPAAHQNECTEHEIVGRLKAMIADGKIDSAEFRDLCRLIKPLEGCEARSHDIGEAVKL